MVKQARNELTNTPSNNPLLSSKYSWEADGLEGETHQLLEIYCSIILLPRGLAAILLWEDMEAKSSHNLAKIYRATYSSTALSLVIGYKSVITGFSPFHPHSC